MAAVICSSVAYPEFRSSTVVFPSCPFISELCLNAKGLDAYPFVLCSVIQFIFFTGELFFQAAVLLQVFEVFPNPIKPNFSRWGTSRFQEPQDPCCLQPYVPACISCPFAFWWLSCFCGIILAVQIFSTPSLCNNLSFCPSCLLFPHAFISQSEVAHSTRILFELCCFLLCQQGMESFVLDCQLLHCGSKHLFLYCSC